MDEKFRGGRSLGNPFELPEEASKTAHHAFRINCELTTGGVALTSRAIADHLREACQEAGNRQGYANVNAIQDGLNLETTRYVRPPGRDRR